MVHGLLFGKNRARAYMYSILVINAKNYILSHHSRFYLYPHTNTKYSTPTHCLKISGIQCWLTIYTKGSRVPSLSFQARPKVGFSISTTLPEGICQLIRVCSWESGIARIFSRNTPKMGT